MMTIKHINNRSKTFTICIIVLIISVQSFASGLTYLNEKQKGQVEESQQLNIRGTVRSADDNLPLPGVNVTVKNEAIGSVTDFDGNYDLVVPSNESILVFSYVGFVTQEIRVGDQTTIDIQLKVDDNALDEVVVVGYGAQKRETLTGAVETISAETFESRAVTNVGLALQGQSPGLVVTRNSPRPGNEGIQFRIRGATSINGNDPLIVVDGVPIINNSSFLNLNPDDIESISVLKDGAAAIYGSRASNGVVLVTTKRGKGKMRITYDFNTRFQTNGITGYSPSMMEYANVWLAANEEEATPNYWVWGSRETLERMAAGEEGRYDLFNTDFYIYNANRIEEMFATRYSYQHNLSLSNGGDKSSYRLSLAYADNQGNLATAYDGQKQLNARFNYDYKLSEKLNLKTNISLINTKSGEPSVGLDNTLYAFDMPFYPAKNPYGNWFATFNGIDGGAIRNAAAMTSEGGRNDEKRLTGRIDAIATYEIIEGLKVEGTASFQEERFSQETYVVPVQLYNWYNTPTGIGLNTGGNNNRYYAMEYKSSYQYYSAILSYEKTLNDLHHFAATAGVNAEKFKSQSLSGQRIGFEDLGVYDLSLGSTDVQTNGGGKSLNGRYSYLARLKYDYDEKYLVEVNGRRDGNSRFAKGFKFKNFGSAQLGWVFTKESFLQGLENTVNFGKIRASYGVLGNEANGLGAFDYLSTIGIGTTVIGQPASVQQTSFLNNNGLISLTRTWEKVEQKNLGVDLRFLDRRLSTSFDVFEKNNIGMLINVTYPSVLGGSAPKTNSGNFKTTGWEFQIGWEDNREKFSYGINFNISDTRTEINDVEGADNFGAGRNGVVNGFPYNSWFLYKTDGYFQTQDEVDAYYQQYGGSEDLANLPQTNQAVALRPGDTRKVDVAGSNNITDLGNEESSLIYAGDANPHYVFGLNLNGRFKGFDLTAFFQGHLKQNIMRNGYMAYPFSALFTNQNSNFLGQTWTEENTGAAFPRLTVNTTRAAWNYQNNDFMLQNNRYVRLKTLILGYTIPQVFSERFKLDKIRFYFSGNDLWEATSIKDGFDPEMGESSINSGYPFARTWSFGVNVAF